MERFNTIEVIVDQPDLPTWSTPWPGYDGCSSSSCYFNTPQLFSGPPVGSWETYDPILVQEIKSPKKVKGLRRGYPPFQYTDYRVAKITTRQHLVRRYDGATGHRRFYQYGCIAKEGGSTCHRVIQNVTDSGVLYSYWYNVRHDYSSYSNYITNVFDPDELADAVNQVKADAVLEAQSSYDILTDIAEMREVPSLFNSMTRDVLSVLKFMRRNWGRNLLHNSWNIPVWQLRKHPDRAMRKLGDWWMSYRYGIMPLIYSAQDILKTIDRGCDVETRKHLHIAPVDTNVPLPDSSSTYTRTRIDGNITIRAAIYQHFESTEISRISGLGFNPFVTAWELVPYSFVFDWFLNVGDYIAAKTNQIWAQKKWACLSRREQYKVITEVHLPMQDKSISIANHTCTNWTGAQPDATPPVILSNPEGYFPLTTVDVDSYNRWVFDVFDVPLRFKPRLKWRRMIDSGVMSLNLLRNLMRSFSKK